MKKTTPKHYAILLHELTRDIPASAADDVIRKFVDLLVRRNQTSLAEKICDEYDRHVLAQEGVREGNLITAHAVTEKEHHALEEAFSKLLGGKIVLRKNIDQNLIGGLVVKFTDLLVDASVKHRLAELRDNLTAVN